MTGAANTALPTGKHPACGGYCGYAVGELHLTARLVRLVEP